MASNETTTNPVTTTTTTTTTATAPAVEASVTWAGLQIPEIHRVSIKIPPFWDADPQMWFINIETQFAIAGIKSDDTKYNYVVSSLDPKYWAEVRDILVNPPAEEKYKKLKSELFRRLSASQDQETRRLLECEGIGDRKPSQFLRYLRGLAGTVIPEDVLRPLWLVRLPAFTQAILASQQEKGLDALAYLADAIADANPRGHVSEASADIVPMQCMFRQLALISTAIAEVTTAVKQIAETRARDRSRSRSQGRWNRSRSRQRYESRDRRYDDGLCWYHACYGSDAKKCTAPCTYNSGNEAGRR